MCDQEAEGQGEGRMGEVPKLTQGKAKGPWGRSNPLLLSVPFQVGPGLAPEIPNLSCASEA